MDVSFLTTGLIIGFSVAVPVGPIGILCIRRTLTYGNWSGYFSGLGAAFADAVYMTLAAFGLTQVTDFLVDQQAWFRMGGGIFLILLGAHSFRTRVTKELLTEPPNTLARDFVSTFFLTLANPITILVFLAIFASFGIRGLNQSSAALLVGGTFTGACMWWTILVSSINSLRSRVTLHTLTIVNKVSGIIVMLFGGVIIAQAVKLVLIP